MKKLNIKNIIFVLFVFTASPGFLYAEELIPGKEIKLDGKNWQEFSGFKDLKILLSIPYNEDAVRRLERCASVIASWTQINAVEMRAEESENDGDSYIVLVNKVIFKDKDYSANLPSGIRLRFDGVLSYDFRLKTGEYFVRLRGILIDDKSLVGEIAKAVTDPLGYITERDPAWAAGRISVLEQTIEASSASIEILRRQMAANLNKTFFGGPKPVTEVIISLVLKLKAGNMATTREDAINAAKAEGLITNKKEIDAIFKVWFNE